MSETPKQAENHEQQLNKAEIQRLIFLSFMHSQGDLTLQYFLASWFRNYYGKQDEATFQSASEQFVASMFSSKSAALDTFTLAEKNTHTARLNDELSAPGPIRRIDAVRQTEEADPLVADHYEKSVEEIIKVYLARTIKQDRHYLEEGRPGRITDGVLNLKDRYFSFYKHYIAENNPTGDKALDALCDKAREMLATYSRPQDIAELENLYSRRLTESNKT